MATKIQILNDVDSFSAADLAQFINEGIVTMEELEETGEFPRRKRLEVNDIIVNGEVREWEKADKANTEEAYNQYLRAYPAGKYSTMARAKIKAISDAVLAGEELAEYNKARQTATEEAYRGYLTRYPNGRYVTEINGRINDIHRGIDDLTKLRSMLESNVDYEILTQNGQLKEGSPVDILKLLAENQNIIDAWTVKRMLDSDLITSSDLQNIGIKKGFIDKLFTFKPRTSTGEKVKEERALPPTGVTGIDTEIYFWGIPSSGKTCTIGAVVGAAKKGNKCVDHFEIHTDSNAYYYMLPLAAKFVSNKINELPEGTATHMINEMKYTFVEKNKKEHRVAFLDLAGEIFTCMLQSDAGYTLRDQQQKTLDNLTKLLTGLENRKMHFFVIQYGSEDKEFDGHPQSDYLEAATAYIKKHNVFKENTDSIYIIITKTDLIPADVEDKQQHLKDYIIENFGNLYRNLKDICEKNNINKTNNGEIEFILMTLGEVCFQNFCLFNPETASNVLGKIIEKSVATEPKSVLNLIFEILRG